MSASKRLIALPVAALVLLSSTIVLAHDEDADTPWRLSGTWASQAVFDPVNGTPPLPPLLEVNSIHDDGTVTSFFATQNFGAIGGTHPDIPERLVVGEDVGPTVGVKSPVATASPCAPPAYGTCARNVPSPLPGNTLMSSASAVIKSILPSMRTSLTRLACEGRHGG